MDLINCHFENELLHEYRCGRKSLNSEIDKNLTCGHYRTVIKYDDTKILIDKEKISFKKVKLSEGEILKDSYILINENGQTFPDLFKRTFYTRHVITTGSK